MKVLHITPHMGGGVGTTILNWMANVDRRDHTICCFEKINERSQRWALEHGLALFRLPKKRSCDILLYHYWDHWYYQGLAPAVVQDLLGMPAPEHRIIFWCHKNFKVEAPPLGLFVATSPVIFDNNPHIKEGRVVWSSSGPEKYFDTVRIPSDNFNVLYIGNEKKMHPDFWEIMRMINMPNVRILIAGDVNAPKNLDERFRIYGHVEDITTLLQIADVFAYPLKPDHHGTCEQVLGEAMAAGVPPVVMGNPAENQIIHHNLSGLVSKDTNDFIFNVKRLYQIDSLRKYISVRARIRAMELYSTKKMVAAWEGIFREVMND